MRSLVIALAIAGGLSACAAAASAQDYNSNANFGEVRLSAGFAPDPSLTSLRAGGSVDASSRFNSCQGFITDAPDMRLYWEGSSSLPLKISAISNSDVTLVINGPDGQWYCDDDSGEDSNPSLTLKPQSGRYEIWVGTYSRGEVKNAVVSISELSSF